MHRRAMAIRPPPLVLQGLLLRTAPRHRALFLVHQDPSIRITTGTRKCRPKDCSILSSDPMMERPCAESEEKHEPASDADAGPESA